MYSSTCISKYVKYLTSVKISGIKESSSQVGESKNLM